MIAIETKVGESEASCNSFTFKLCVVVVVVDGNKNKQMLLCEALSMQIRKVSKLLMVIE